MNKFDEPLSLKFIHKPARTQELVNRKVGEQKTRRNSDTNKQLVLGGDTKSTNSLGPGKDSNTGDTSNMRNFSFFSQHVPDLHDDTASIDSNPDASLSQAGLGDEDVFRYKLVRKKSGEILKSNLKDPSYFDHTVSKSLPTTPSYKQVHFGDASDVRYFNKKDKPAAISASNSPTLQSPDFSLNVSEDEASDASFDSGDDPADERTRDVNDLLGSSRHSFFNGSTAYPNPKHSHLIDWNLDLVNFSPMDYDTNISRHVPVFLERVFISIDKKYLLGHVAVKNLSFEKSVTMRYTFDNWGTIIEIPTIYVPDIPTVLRSNGYDRFVFKVQLNKMFNNFGANMHFQKNNYKFCIKYVANNTNYWDNNSMRDYEINLTKIITQANSPVARTNFSDNSVFNRTGSADSLTSLNSKGFKPRYSSSYLRRRSSDSKLSTLESDADYVKNNFYLSSPLLSNYSSGSFSSDVLNPSKSNTSTDTLIPNKNFLNPHDSNPLDLKSLNASLFTDNDNYNSPSYQQLIDNYCFFTPGGSQPQKSSSGSNQKESGNPSSSSSSGSNSASEPAGGLDGSSEFSSSTFTVSSLLGT